MSSHRSTWGTAGLLLTALALGACAGGPDPDSAAMSHMYAHYTEVGEILSAVVRGDVAATRNPARWLAGHKPQEFPPASEEHLEIMRAEGRIIAAQTQVDQIALSVARMAVACGDCHTTTGGGPKINVDMAPTASTDPERTMVRHVWASDRMWEGIFAPSDAAWASGAAVMAAPALDLGPPGNRPKEADELAERVPELGQKAKSAKSLKERAAIYGQLLQTCARCHDALGMKMR